MKAPTIRGECHPVYVAMDTDMSSGHSKPNVVVQLSVRVLNELATHGLGVPTFKFLHGEAADCAVLIIGLEIGTHEHRIVADIGDSSMQGIFRQAEDSNTMLLTFEAEGAEVAVQRPLAFPDNFLEALRHFGAKSAQQSVPNRLGDLVVIANRLAELSDVPSLSETFEPKSTSIGVMLTDANAKLLQPVIAASKGQGHVFH